MYSGFSSTLTAALKLVSLFLSLDTFVILMYCRIYFVLYMYI